MLRCGIVFSVNAVRSAVILTLYLFSLVNPKIAMASRPEGTCCNASSEGSSSRR